MTTTVGQDRAFIESVIDPYLLEAAINWIQSNMDPEDVFDRNQLVEWALENDFVEGSDNES